jgi:regulator of RNase E activity RraB
MSDETIDIEAMLPGHAARNHALVDQLLKRGVDLDVSRAIEHHFWADGHRHAVELAHELYRRGFVILVLAKVKTDDTSRDLWNVEAEALQSVKDTIGENAVRDLVELAALRNCVYDGWGTRV